MSLAGTHSHAAYKGHRVWALRPSQPWLPRFRGVYGLRLRTSRHLLSGDVRALEHLAVSRVNGSPKRPGRHGGRGRSAWRQCPARHDLRQQPGQVMYAIADRAETAPLATTDQELRPYHDLMTATSDPADWLAWWSWPWRVAGAWPGAFPSLAPQELSQPILPGWLFANSISVTEENSRSPETERDIVAVHSYGQQLGRIIDVVDELIRERPAGAPDSGPVREFARLRDDIAAIKARQAAKRAEQVISDLAGMKRRNPGEYQRLAAELRKFLDDSGD